MALSLRTKAIIPIATLAVVVLVAMLVVAHISTEVHEINHDLTHRFEKLEEVRRIETFASRLVHPHIIYATSGDEYSRQRARTIFSVLDQIVRDLEDNENNELRLNILADVKVQLLAAQQFSDAIFRLKPKQADRHMGLIAELSRYYLDPIGKRMRIWHQEQLLEVELLHAQSGSRADVGGWVLLSLLMLVALMLALAVWFNDRILTRPIMTIARGTSRLAAGELQNKIGILANDELGVLAADINHMAESLDKVYSKLNDMAHTDALTGLMNRHGFDAIIRHELSRARRYEQPAAMIMLDVDRFKQFNDQHGHECGDAMLRHVASLCRDNLRASDYCFRYGGEEFLILLTMTDEENLPIVVERLRASIESTPMEWRDQPFKVTVSLGVATMKDGCHDKDSLLRAADEALYEAKSGGRNQAVFYNRLEQHLIKRAP